MFLGVGFVQIDRSPRNLQQTNFQRYLTEWCRENRKTNFENNVCLEIQSAAKCRMSGNYSWAYLFYESSLVTKSTFWVSLFSGQTSRLLPGMLKSPRKWHQQKKSTKKKTWPCKLKWKMNFPGCGLVQIDRLYKKTEKELVFSFIDRVDVKKIEKKSKSMFVLEVTLRRNVACPVITLEPICCTSYMTHNNTLFLGTWPNRPIDVLGIFFVIFNCYFL